MSNEIQYSQCGRILEDERDMTYCDTCGREGCGDCIVGGYGGTDTFCEGCSE